MTDAQAAIEPTTVPRCRWTIRFGTTLTTRCSEIDGHGIDSEGDFLHRGNGLEQFPYQRIEWLPGDRREFQTDREDVFAWEATAP